MPLAVGVDAANLLRDRRGIGRYVRALARTWSESFADRIALTLFVPHAFPTLVEARLRDSLGVADVRVARRSRAASVDLVWYPWNGMTWVAQRPCVVTVHDLWPYVSPSSDRRAGARERSHYETAKQFAKRFIAVSRFTADELVARLHVDPARVDVVPHGVAPLTNGRVEPERVPDVERYVLFVGETEARKDVATLLEAARLLPDSVRHSTAVVIAGKNGASSGLNTVGVRVDAVGEVSDQRLASLYAGAAAFVFPSRYEGFGFPVLEAMQYGAPVIASDAAGVPEAAGDAALAFPAGDARALAGALQRVLEETPFARALSDKGRARAATMTWARCAQRTLESFERALHG